MYMCICVSTQTDRWTEQTYTHECMQTHAHTHKRAHAHKHIQTDPHTHLHPHTSACTHRHMHTHAHAHAHTHYYTQRSGDMHKQTRHSLRTSKVTIRLMGMRLL